MPVAFESVVGPEYEPVSLAEAKGQCRLDDVSDYDGDLNFLIQVAREKVESDSERAFVTQSRRMWIDQFPVGCQSTYAGILQAVVIPVKPITGITSIQYIDLGGEWQTMDPSDYLADLVTYPARITPAYAMIWPLTRVQINAVKIDFVCGHLKATQIPAAAKHAMRLLVGHWFVNREAVGNVPDEIALGYESLINMLRWH